VDLEAAKAAQAAPAVETPVGAHLRVAPAVIILSRKIAFL
jgi:hypothetical protein